MREMGGRDTQIAVIGKKRRFRSLRRVLRCIDALFMESNP